MENLMNRYYRCLIVSFMVALYVTLFSSGYADTASPPPIQIEFMASATSWTNNEYVGHAFLCISIPLNSGIKEDCYGFYPRSSSPKGFIGGPGVTVSEFQKNPSRFSRVT